MIDILIVGSISAIIAGIIGVLFGYKIGYIEGRQNAFAIIYQNRVRRHDQRNDPALSNRESEKVL